MAEEPEMQSTARAQPKQRAPDNVVFIGKA